MRTQAVPISSPATETPEPDPSMEGPLSDLGHPSDQPSVISTRASRTWMKVVPALLLLGVILLFVFENLGRTKVRFATASGTMPLALALLAAAALGGLLVFTLGSIRIVQLRRVIHRSPRKPRS